MTTRNITARELRIAADYIERKPGIRNQWKWKVQNTDRYGYCPAAIITIDRDMCQAGNPFWLEQDKLALADYHAGQAWPTAVLADLQTICLENHIAFSEIFGRLTIDRGLHRHAVAEVWRAEAAKMETAAHEYHTRVHTKKDAVVEKPVAQPAPTEELVHA